MFGFLESGGSLSWMILAGMASLVAIIASIIHLQHKAELESLEKIIRDTARREPTFGDTKNE